MSVSRMMRVIKNRAIMYVSNYPRRFCFQCGQLVPARSKGFVVDCYTEIVIDGYPRAGNTYAFFAF